jgi:HK97 family phage portal protein
MSILTDWLGISRGDRAKQSGDLVSLDLKAENTTERILSRMPMPKLQAPDTSYESLLRYIRRSEIVYACIEKKAQAACDAELVVERLNASTGEYEPEESHPLVNLFNKPNPYDDGESFRRAWIASENFANVFYAEVIRNRAGQPIQLYPLNPAYIRPEYAYTGNGYRLSHYVYQRDGIQIEFQPEELMIRRRQSLASIYSNISPVALALGSVDTDTSLTDYVRAFFNNQGTPSGIINIKDRRLTEDEAAAWQAAWLRKYGRNGSMRGGPAILDGSQVEYQSIGAQLDELESDSITSKIESRICMAFGVPPILIGAYVGLLHVNQRASVREAQEDFWMNTMSPELKSIRQFITWNLLPEFEGIESIQDGSVRVTWDLSKVMALQEDVDGVYKRAIAGYRGGLLTLNEARTAIGEDSIEEEEGDTFYRAPAPQTAGNGGNDDNGNGDNDDAVKAFLGDGIENKSDNVIEAEVLEVGHVHEKKTVDFDGLTLSREPNEIEKLIDFKSIASSQRYHRERLFSALMALRGELIAEAIKDVETLTPETIYELILTPPTKLIARIRQVIAGAYATGKAQIVSELSRQGVGGLIVTGGENAELIDTLADTTVSRVTNEIQTRAINQFATATVLGIAGAGIGEYVGRQLRDQSDKWVDGYAGAASNAAIQGGRSDEAEAKEDFIDRYQYSAILDALTCSPCESWDGVEAASPEELPQTPNAECEGGDRCRCFIVAIHGEAQI